eukprot:CAMPEP_0119505834 /NCGR_PEP_ID=MMETSP1344-20130328/26269_1 /TAXON_ID=236787 /ORGANISM="Florenciella parvula, Strain CCMP2471" /LENGTH=34 /DNA_ID= /DNA_START= /DNA_END= /DNA_ORIENTATION=
MKHNPRRENKRGWAVLLASLPYQYLAPAQQPTAV